jgi:hypothetical protein
MKHKYKLFAVALIVLLCFLLITCKKNHVKPDYLTVGRYPLDY